MKASAEKIVQNRQDFFRKAGLKKAVLGLSGGVDSALTAKLAVMALGKENVTAILMPYDGMSSKSSLVDAKTLADQLGIDYKIVQIKECVERYKKLPWEETEEAHMNIQARIRMTVLYHFANTHKALVLGTGNKTEETLGYFTKHGDGGVDLLPIGSLYKTDVWKMAKELGLPAPIINKTPSAELKPGHTDEAEIGMTYAEMDEILKKFEAGQEAKTNNEKQLQKRIQANRHKSMMPPVIEG